MPWKSFRAVIDFYDEHGDRRMAGLLELEYSRLRGHHDRMREYLAEIGDGRNALEMGPEDAAKVIDIRRRMVAAGEEP